ncbi:MAG: RnfABCDGE type electron transport complex subunit D, partial [Victivallales bacterium]
GIMLIAFKLIKWQVPVFYIGTVAVFASIINCFFPGVTPPAMFHLLTGGLLLGAIFMATDMVTSPMTTKGAVIFGIGCGIVTCVIRIWGNYPEGVSFAILFMNALVPLIDRFATKKPFGYHARDDKEGAKA